MAEFAVAVLAKVGLALAEAVVARLIWQVWTAYVRAYRAEAAAA